MIYTHFTATGSTANYGVSSNVFSGPAKKVLVQVNAALTGTLTVDDTALGTTAGNVATITNPTVGSQYEYWGFRNGVNVYASTTCDVTVSADLSRGGV